MLYPELLQFFRGMDRLFESRLVELANRYLGNILLWHDEVGLQALVVLSLVLMHHVEALMLIS
jgi:hypothetical protein